MQIDDTASPAPSTVTFDEMAAGSVARRSNGHYITKAYDGTAYDATADAPLPSLGGEALTPVPGKLVIG